ncbi:MAG: hypothetical protein E7328_02425 [Clostridiales bacterium]|nr:hypothetical protein [Clostridiales bacterium]
METDVVVALMGLLGTAIGSVGGVFASNKLVNHRLNRLEAKMDKHNNFIERLTVVEQRSKSNTHRLDELEHTH